MMSVEKLRAKWSEIPAGSDRADRQFSTNLVKLPDNEILAYWNAQFSAADDIRGWYQNLYRETFRGKKVLEIGSGMGYDGIYFISQGADWTFTDIAESNLSLVNRIAKLKGLSGSYLFIHRLNSLEALPSDFDFVWCNGSLLHLPFHAAAEESRAIMRHLKLGGRWIELAYPRERWAREGSPPFDAWGRMTDGEGTPWTEWYDLEKIKHRLFPYKVKPLLDMKFSSDYYIWFDLLYAGELHSIDDTKIEIAVPERFSTPDHIWNQAWSIAVGDKFESSTKNSLSVSADIICTVEGGAIGFAFETNGAFVSREIVIDARSYRQAATITTHEFGAGTHLSARNASANGPSTIEIHAIVLRPAI